MPKRIASKKNMDALFVALHAYKAAHLSILSILETLPDEYTTALRLATGGVKEVTKYYMNGGVATKKLTKAILRLATITGQHTEVPNGKFDPAAAPAPRAREAHGGKKDGRRHAARR